MKTKIAAVLISLLFMISCGTEEQPKEGAPAENTNSNKMILKASNNMYVAIGADSTLSANQSDATKAEVFEKVDQGNGKFALKTSAGKFVSDVRSAENKLYANRAAVGEWEQFEIINVEGGKINLKSSAGKMVCGDQGTGGIMVANRDNASDWETFTAETK
jgi:hypothetical protein